MHYKKGSAGLQVIADLSEFTGITKGASYTVKPLEYKEEYEI